MRALEFITDQFRWRNIAETAYLRGLLVFALFARKRITPNTANKCTSIDDGTTNHFIRLEEAQRCYRGKFGLANRKTLPLGDQK